MTIIIFIIVLAIIILVHEFGHFIVAKKSGVKVEEFGIGLPPRAWGKKIGETLYSINWIPLGGFVRMLGENDASDSEDRARSFAVKPKKIRALILIAGISFNLIFAWLLISLGFAIGLPAPAGASVFGQTQNIHTTITSVLAKSPADIVGLKTGDEVVSVKVDSTPVPDPTAENISTAISKSIKGDVTITYERGSSPVKTVTVTPSDRIIQGERLVGISMESLGTLKLPFYTAILEGAHTTYLLIISTGQGLVSFLWQVVRFKSNWSEVSGPIGIASVVRQATELGFVYLLSLVALISINLALINLVPFPALDGGLLLFVGIEAITGKKVPPKVASWINSAGFILLLILMLFISVHDVINLRR